MKTKIQIKSFMGKVLFEYEKENNTIKDTLINAVKSSADLRGACLGGAYLSGADLSGADLSGADLRGADLIGADLGGAYLSGADLSGADLSGADLRGADLIGADLSGADLSGADLSGADLRGADLRGADLSGADLRGADLRGADLIGIKIKKATFIINIYKYDCAAIISEDDKYYIKLGCYLREVKEWNKDFWNNTSEFPNDNSVKSQLRVLAFETMKKWIDINK